MQLACFSFQAKSMLLGLSTFLGQEHSVFGGSMNVSSSGDVAGWLALLHASAPAALLAMLPAHLCLHTFCQYLWTECFTPIGCLCLLGFGAY